MVAPFTGAWIEIPTVSWCLNSPYLSHPSRVRGLKSEIADAEMNYIEVAPFTGAWIEIDEMYKMVKELNSRTLHGCVD